MAGSSVNAHSNYAALVHSISRGKIVCIHKSELLGTCAEAALCVRGEFALEVSREGLLLPMRDAAFDDAPLCTDACDQRVFVCRGALIVRVCV